MIKKLLYMFFLVQIFCYVESYVFVISESVRQDYKIYFNSTFENEIIEQNRYLVTLENCKTDIFLTEYEIGNRTVLDLRIYTFKLDLDFIYTATDHGIFFPENSARDIKRFIHSGLKSEILLTDYGFLFFNRIEIANQYFLSIKMLKRGHHRAIYRGLIMTFDDMLNFAVLLNTSI